MMELLQNVFVPLIYLVSALMFIFGLKRMTKVPTARSGNLLSAIAMLLAVVATLLEMGLIDYRWIISGLAVGSAIGAFAALRVPMTSMPEMVALFNGSGGLSSAVVALSTYALVVMERPAKQSFEEAIATLGTFEMFSVGATLLIGGVTFVGSIIAWAKLQGKINRGN